LPAVSTAARASSPVTSAAQRVETSVHSNQSSAQTASARLHNTAASDKKLLQQQKKKSAKAMQRELNADNLKTQRQADDVSSDSSVMRPDRDVSTTVSRQRSDFDVDIRTTSQPRQPTADGRRTNTAEFGGRLPESSSTSYRDQQSSSHIRAEEFLQVSSLPVDHQPTLSRCCSLIIECNRILLLNTAAMIIQLFSQQTYFFTMTAH